MELSHACRNGLYRLRMSVPDETFVFVMASDRENAARKARAALSILQDIPLHEARVQSLDSFSDLMHFGVSADRDLRVFEAGSKRGKASFISMPLFLTSDTSLLGKWAEFNAARCARPQTHAADFPANATRAFASGLPST
jgi:hypothetical protein